MGGRLLILKASISKYRIILMRIIVSQPTCSWRWDGAIPVETELRQWDEPKVREPGTAASQFQEKQKQFAGYHGVTLWNSLSVENLLLKVASVVGSLNYRHNWIEGLSLARANASYWLGECSTQHVVSNVYEYFISYPHCQTYLKLLSQPNSTEYELRVTTLVGPPIVL